jgi:hypothetical protein
MADGRRRAAQILDTAPVLILAAIAGAGSFVHIRDTAAQHGQRGPMAWAIAVCIDLTCVMAARERQRDKRTRRATRPLSWPVLVLGGGVLLSLAANLDQAQPDTWGRITAATPAAAFLVAVSMLERRTIIRTLGTARDPAVLPVPGEDDQAVPIRTVPDDRPVPVLAVPGQPSGPDQSVGQSEVRPAAALLDFARRVAAEHQDSHGQPITRDTLRARLGVSNQLASDLLRQIRTTPETT